MSFVVNPFWVPPRLRGEVNVRCLLLTLCDYPHPPGHPEENYSFLAVPPITPFLRVSGFWLAIVTFGNFGIRGNVPQPFLTRPLHPSGREKPNILSS